jgi:hypothetical protein
MGKKGFVAKFVTKPQASAPGRPSALRDTRVVYRGDNLEQLAKPALTLPKGLPDGRVKLTYVDPAPVSEVELPFNYKVFWGETKEKRSFEERHASTQAYIDFLRPRYVQLARVLKNADSFYYHCDWHATVAVEQTSAWDRV